MPFSLLVPQHATAQAKVSKNPIVLTQGVLQIVDNQAILLQ
ncbi:MULTISPECIES: hypothetical protein [unclassified Acinetobacter]